MKSIRILVQAVFLSGVLTPFLSCNAQNGSANLRSSSSEISIGKTVSELDDRIMAIFQDANDNYWFASGDQGVFKYDGENLVLYSSEDGLCSNSVIGIQEDKFGNIYFDSADGVCKFDGQKFTTLEEGGMEASENEWRLDPDDLWFSMGWNNVGPIRFDGDSLYQLVFPKTELVDTFYANHPNVSYSPYGIYKMYKDHSGHLWFGTASIGVGRYDGELISWLYEEQLSKTPEGGDFGFRSIIEDKEGDFWFCNPHYRYEISPDITVRNGTNYMNYNRKEGIGYANANGETEYPFFMSIEEDDAGNLWMATYDSGVWRNDGETLTHYPVRDGDSGVLLFTIYKDNRGVLWLGSHNAGAFKYNGASFEKFEL